MNELRKDPTIIEWLTTINSRPNTERNYILGFQWFTEYTGKGPETLLLEAEQEIKDGLLMRQRSIKKYLTGFRKYLQDKGNAPHTVKSHITGVKSFYQSFDIEIPKLTTRSGSKAQTLKKHKEIPTKEDIQEVLKVCDPLEKAVLLVGASSGLSAHEIINLRVSDFKKGHDEETGITTLDLRRGKVEFDFITFLSPEASKAVQDYLTYRARTVKTGELRRLNQLDKQRVFSDNDYLFIKRHIDINYLKDHDDELRKHDQDSFVKVYRNISEKAQKNTPKGDWNLIRSHNIRKYFNSALRNAGADTFHTEFFMGHTLPDAQSPYFKPDPKSLRDEYAKYVPFITIEKSLDISESEDFKRIKSEHETLLVEAETHRIERTELQVLREEIEKLKRSMVEKTAQEENFRRLVDEEISHLVRPSIPTTEEYRAHKKKILSDPEYRTRFDRSEEAYLNEKEGNDGRLVELKAVETEEVKRAVKTFDTLLDKL
jgi:integrase